MPWFEYLPEDYTSIEQEKRIRPPFRLGLNIEAPFSTIKKNTILFAKIVNNSFYTFYDQNPKKQIDNTRYVVVFHPDESSNKSIVVKSNVHDGVLYFLSAQDHIEGQRIYFKYYVYFGKPFIKYVTAIDENADPINYVEASESKIEQVNSYNVECD